MGIREGLMLREYQDTIGQKQQTAKLQAQLYGAQAKHFDAQNQLINLEVQKHQAFMQGLPGVLGQSPGGSGLQTQLSGSGPDAQPPSLRGPQVPQDVAPTADSFLDPQEAVLDRMSLLAARTGNFKDYGTLQQGLIERQKIRTAGRLQTLQDQLGLIQMAEGQPEVTPDRRAVLRNAKASLLFQIGKSNDALQTLEGKLNVTQAGGSVSRLYPGEAQATNVYTNPTSLGQAEADKTQARLNVETGVHPTTGKATRRDVSKNVKLGTQDAELAPPDADAGPPPGQQRFGTSLDGQSLKVDAWSAAHAQQILTTQYPGRAFVLTPEGAAAAPTGTPGAAAVIAGQKKGEELRQQGLQPANPTNPVAAQTEQTKMNVEVYGSPTPPQGQPNATIEDVQAKRSAGENLPDSTQGGLGTLLHAERLTKSLQSVSEKDAGSYIGYLRKPVAELASFFQDIETPGKGNPGLYRFLADAKELFYLSARSEGGRGGVGANFTILEQKLLKDVFPDAGASTYTAFKTALERLGPMLSQKIDDATTLASTTRGTLKKDVQERRGGGGASKAGAPASGTAPATETPREQANRLLKQRGLPPLPEKGP